jgi:hypothetical protein
MKIYNITLVNDESDISLRELPVKFVYRDSRFFGALVLFAGISAAAIPLGYFIKIIISGGSWENALFLPGAAILLVPLILLGLNLFKKKKEMIISKDSVSKSYVSLFKKDRWEEPVPAYRGILMRTDVEITGERSSALIYALDLLHDEEIKSIRLFKSMDFNTAFDKWKEYCQMFSLPALERIGKEKNIQRPGAELGTALIDLVKKKLVTIYDTPPSLPDQVEISEDEAGTTVILPDKTEILLGKKALTIKQNTVRPNVRRFEYADVKSITVDYCQLYKKWAWALVIIERRSTHRSVFAHDLSYDVLEWLHNYLIDETAGRIPS